MTTAQPQCHLRSRDAHVTGFSLRFTWYLYCWKEHTLRARDPYNTESGIAPLSRDADTTDRGTGLGLRDDDTNKSGIAPVSCDADTTDRGTVLGLRDPDITDRCTILNSRDSGTSESKTAAQGHVMLIPLRAAQPVSRDAVTTDRVTA